MIEQLCSACGRSVPSGADSCPTCGGVATPASDAPTAFAAPASPPPSAFPASRGSIPSVPSADGARFAPGEVIGGRFRIVTRLGRGGMGEVYRADDLKVRQPVALKFLAPQFARDVVRVEMLAAEVRAARDVSHPNVCRVYDLGEADGQPYVAMEFIDGEDLASLLPRIGRFPRERALDIARQLCAGLAAVHERGLLHRDLKPANVMLDGRGRARLTDFGIAITGAEAADGGFAGTPEYMAPELFAGGQASVRSDVYALGLVLYELFTGKRGFSAPTIAELRKLKSGGTLAPVSTHVRDVDPLVEQVIERCLAADPAQRPSSALAVAALLPGGDPLAAALAAGETPSPEMIAASGGVGALKPALAWSLVAAAVVMLIVGSWFGARSSPILRAAPPKAPAVLEERAREIIAATGAKAPAVDDYSMIEIDTGLIRSMKPVPGTGRFDFMSKVPGSAFNFYYRQSPVPLECEATPGLMSFWEPWPRTPGMANVTLDGGGRLRHLRIVPPDHDPAPSAGVPPLVDWAPFFKAAGLDIANATPVPPRWTPSLYVDGRAAWTIPAAPLGAAGDLRVEAGSFHGHALAFKLIAPWEDVLPKDEDEPLPARRTSNGEFIEIAAVSCLLASMGLLAVRQLRSGRGDVVGAWRVGLAFGVIDLVQSLLGLHGLPRSGFFLSVTWYFSASAVIRGALVGLSYLAVEPFVRRAWPGFLVGWNRLLAGRFNDPRVGREWLAGCLVGMTMRLTGGALRAGLGQLGYDVLWLDRNNYIYEILGVRSMLILRLQSIIVGGFITSALLGTFVAGYALTRRRAAGPILIALIFVPLSVEGVGGRMLGAPAYAAVLGTILAVGLQTFATLRWGPLAGLAFCWTVECTLPLPIGSGAWFAPYLVGESLIVLAPAVYAAWITSRPLTVRTA